MREGPLAALFRKTETDESAQDGADGADAGAPQSQTPAARDERGAPHPALSSSEPKSKPKPASRERSSSAGVPTPKERLQQAFSSEIPASLMDRETLPLRPPRPRAARGR